MTGTYRITERNDETDELVRVVAMLSDVDFKAAVTAEKESIASPGHHLQLERWNDILHHADGVCGWEYL